MTSPCERLNALLTAADLENVLGLRRYHVLVARLSRPMMISAPGSCVRQYLRSHFHVARRTGSWVWNGTRSEILSRLHGRRKLLEHFEEVELSALDVDTWRLLQRTELYVLPDGR